MPFLGQDWRSPGEQWVKSPDGWERLRMWRMKLFENLNENVIARLIKLAEADMNKTHRLEAVDCHSSQPHIYWHKLSREQKMQISLSDVFTKLDISGAVKDVRRFNYVAKLLELLIQHKMCSLSGSAQKNLLSVVEDAFNTVMKTQTNVHIMKQLISQLRFALEEGHYSHLGSSSLWARHLDNVTRMHNLLNSMQINEREEDGKLMLADLPDDCMRQILLRFTDYEDIINTGLTEERTGGLVAERAIWRELCLYHFDDCQLLSIIKDPTLLQHLDTEGWKHLHIRLVKRYGQKDVYPEMVHLCRHCNALFWQHHGHPCLLPDLPRSSLPLTPVMCVELFTA